jgi:hypothetical protein
MKNTLLIVLSIFLFTSNSGNLFDDVKFVKGKALKNNVPVIYYTVGRTAENNINVLALFGERIKSHSSLGFYYNNKKHYLPISNRAVPDFLFNLEEGDTLLIDIVIFDTLKNNRGVDQSIKNYYSYVNRIQKTR